MKIDSDLLKRFKLFGSGMFLGILLLVFFFNGKKSSCNWFPNARALEYIRHKNINYSDALKMQLVKKELDSNAVNNLLLKGKINFSKSKQRKKPCQLYFINGKVIKQKINFTVQVCDSIATISKINFIN